MTVAIETRSGEAGHSGTEIRSDLYVRIEPRDHGGITLELESRVKALLRRLDPATSGGSA